MKNSSIHQWKFCLVWLVFFTYLGLQISCNTENSFDRNVEVNFQISIPGNGSLKNASATAGVKSVVLTVTSGNEVLLTEELTISGNTANGTIRILSGKNRKFTAEAMDENNIIQWQGSTTIDIVDNFTVGIELTPILPSATNLQASQEDKFINLSWTQNTDPDFARYELYRSQEENVLGTIIQSSTKITETEFKDSLISEGKIYYYTLIVLDTEKFEKKSNSISIMMPFIHPTASVLKVNSISNVVLLSWTKNIDMDFARYDLYRSESELSLGKIIHSTTIITQTVFKDSTVSEGNTYYYTVLVLDTDGFNTKSNKEPAVIPNLPPSASVLQGEFNGSVYLNWSKNTDPDFARYELHRSQSENVLGTIIYSTTDVAKLNYGDSQVTEGSIYFYTLVVIDTKGLNTKSNVVQAEIPNYPPTASTLYGNYQVVEDSVSYFYYVELSWTQNYDKDFYKYELYRSTSDKDIGVVIFSTNDVNVSNYNDYDVDYYNYYSFYYTLVVTDIGGLSTESKSWRGN